MLDQVDGKPGLYRGTLKERSTGRTVLLRYEVTVVDPEHMEGTLRANLRAKGEKCWIRQSWNSSYVGK